MIDPNSQFFAILTAAGEAKQANADALGIPWKLTEMGVGDANGTDPIPDRAQTRLINERRRRPLNKLSVDPANPNIIVAEQIIPADEGGWWIREIGLYDADGALVAVANCAPSYKPLMSQGSGRTQVVRMNFIVSSAASVVLKIDPAVVLATRQYVDDSIVDAVNRQDAKASVLVATTGPIQLAGTPTIDGIPVPLGSRVLVKDQAQSKDNGIYLTGEIWKRAADADSSAKVTPGLLVAVEQGTAGADSLWLLSTDGPIVLGTTALSFEVVAGRTGIVAGTYRSLTVDKLGRAIAGTNPETLAAFGIKDAYTKAEIEAMGPMAGTSRGRMNVPQASANATFIADEVLLQDADGKSYRLKAFKQVVNLASAVKGLGAMDVGASPVNGYVALYALYSPSTNERSLMAVNATAAVAPMLYGGANAPPGFTASALLTVVPTGGAGNFDVCFVEDRMVTVGARQILNGAAAITSAPIPVAGAVPLNAVRANGLMGLGSSGVGTVSMDIYSAASGFGLARQTATVSTGGGLYTSAFSNLAIITPQTWWVSASNAASGTPIFNAFITGYFI
ncbi:hypothetical protein BS643_12645 [Pseudomonas protegens]|uniref:phage tail protein n=1 Tax=Pseudomonas protegens TaxID=380021 RepID=UPI00093CD596|nr:phage tail protein [Pseudomonas protegens]OKK46387.1 hypothetical protein BS643_12645 [Pseudomonas protegens]